MLGYQVKRNVEKGSRQLSNIRYSSRQTFTIAYCRLVIQMLTTEYKRLGWPGGELSCLLKIPPNPEISNYFAGRGLSLSV